KCLTANATRPRFRTSLDSSSFFFQAEDGIRDGHVTGVQTCALPISFGDRVHCPFLRPVFLSPADEERVRTVAERIAELGERVVTVALGDKHIFAQLHLSEEEERLARIHVGYGPASTASRLDAFLLPDSLKF